jgi:threonine aldolase
VKEVIPVHTNIVVAIIKDATKRDEIIAKLGEQGIRTMAFGEGMLRMVTHLNVSSSEIDETCEILRKLKV